MVLTYKELIDLFGNDYQIKKQIEEKNIIKLEEGYYTPGDYSPFELLVKKYPNSVFSFLTALYFHGLIKEIPETFYITSKKESTRAKESYVHQFFVNDKNLFEYVDVISIDGVQLMVYSKEKTLISLIKNRNKMSPFVYNEAIHSYRKIVSSLNMHTLHVLLNREKNKEAFKKILAAEILWILETLGLIIRKSLIQSF